MTSELQNAAGQLTLDCDRPRVRVSFSLTFDIDVGGITDLDVRREINQNLKEEPGEETFFRAVAKAQQALMRCISRSPDALAEFAKREAFAALVALPEQQLQRLLGVGEVADLGLIRSVGLDEVSLRAFCDAEEGMALYENLHLVREAFAPKIVSATASISVQQPE